MTPRALPSSAGQDLGEIRGHVVNIQDDQPVAGVLVELHLRDAPQRTVTSSEDGSFRLERVPPGIHRIRVRYLGFHLLERQVEVAPGAVVMVRLELTPTTVDLDTLRVFASPLAIRREDTEFTSRIDRRAIQRLPMPHDTEDMVFLPPGAAPGRIWGGAADEANLYQLDGLPQTNPGTGGPLVSISPSWLEWVEVRGLGAGAEHGNFQGGIVNAVTRSGTSVREGSLRSSLESRALNATNILEAEIGRERTLRGEVDGFLAGPLPYEGLFYFVGGHFLRDDVRAQSRLPAVDHRFLPQREERTELRGFGKLTWTPTATDRVDLSAGLTRVRAQNHGLTGYEGEGASPELDGPARFYQGSWLRTLERGHLELRGAGATSRERIRPVRGEEIPAVRTYVIGDPPSPISQNAVFLQDRRPSTHTLSGEWVWRGATGPFDHRLQLGGEATWSSWMDRRVRTGGMTWRPPMATGVDHQDPGTWSRIGGIIPTDWGGEVDLHAEMGSQAIYFQTHTTLHPRLSVNPGIRFGRWRGDLLPGGDRSRRVHAWNTQAWEPRMGIILDPLGTNELVLKAHWGRYHQNLLAPFFDRAEGGQVFSNRELWYYHGSPLDDPIRTFTAEERDAMTTGDPRFTHRELIRLNETGPVSANLKQPHVDQWIVAVERTFGPRIRLEALVMDRRNRNMVALRDRNLEENYHRFENVQILRAGRFFQDPDTIYFGDEPLTLPELWVSNAWIRQLLVWQALGEGIVLIPPPGFVLADTMWLSFEQDLVLENVPEATRRLRQLQLSGHLAYPSWGASASIVISRLRGNLQSVTGYEAGSHFEEFWRLGSGPFVRPNEQVNFNGPLPGFTPLDLKLALHGDLPWGLRGGLFFHGARGERFTPYFTVAGVGFEYLLREESGRLRPLDDRLARSVAGQRVFLQERGTARYEGRVSLDLRLERELTLGRGTWRVTADVFNVTNSGAVTRVNESVTYPSLLPGITPAGLDSSAVFLAVWERNPPRTFRLGVAAEL